MVIQNVVARPLVQVGDNETPAQALLRSKFAQSELKPGTSFALGAQIGGSGINLVLAAADSAEPKDARVYKLNLPFAKVVSDQDDNDLALNRTQQLQKLFAMIDCVSRAIREINSHLDVCFSIAGFDTQKPPTGIDPEILREANANQAPTRYHTTNIPSLDKDGKVIRHIDFQSYTLPKPGTKHADQTDGADYVFHTDSGNSYTANWRADQSMSDSSRTINFYLNNDTTAVASSTLEGLQDGDNAIGVVCGTGFNIGLARNFNTKTQRFAELENLEAGHDNFFNNYAFVEDGGDYPQTPEIAFAGTSGDNLRGFRKLLRNLTENHWILLTDELKQELKNIFDQDPVNSPRKLEKQNNIWDLTDKEIDDLMFDANSKTPELKAVLRTHYKLTYLARLASFIREKMIKAFPDATKAPKINLTGSAIVSPLSRDADFRNYFIQALNNRINVEDLRYTVAESDLVLHGKDSMDGLVDLVKYKAAQARVQVN